MINHDLIAWLEPVASRFCASEWHDVTGAIQDIQEADGKLTIRTELSAGIYRGMLMTRREAFDMDSAGVEMTRVPDGAKVLLGPWDLNHIDRVMAIPMAMVTVNGRFRGGLWFSMPGPDEIREGVLQADFGFEHDGGTLELILELSSRDKERLSWSSLKSLEIRKDDRRFVPLTPISQQRPRFFTAGLNRPDLERKLRVHPGFEEARTLLDASAEEWQIFYEQSTGLFDTACLIGYATGDKQILGKAKQRLLALCSTSTWSGGPDPLLMGGDNDRAVGFRLAITGIGWEFLREFLSEQERAVVLKKAEEYIGKMYDFTLLQRGYMGCPTPDAHSLGTWWGVGIACMAFYDELPIAKKVLPFFHALMLDSLKLMPASGKSAWATFYPIWPVRYLAAATEFGGPLREVADSPFLGNLEEALRSCFLAPNSQEIQRGLRTVEHRIITAFLAKYRPSDQTASIYAAFVEEEKRQAGNVHWSMFDLLYAPEEMPPPAKFPEDPFFARDIGELILTMRHGGDVWSLGIAGGIKSGAENCFRLQAHNRENPRSMGDLSLSINGSPVVTGIQSSYGRFSAQRNVLCFENGCGVAEGQYLHGEISPEHDAFVRRLLIGERFVYLDVNLTRSLRPDLGVRYAQRIYLLDRDTATILIHDIFETEAERAASTHLHSSGRITELGEGHYQLTGGQANTIAGIKFGDVGMSDAETGEVHVKVLETGAPWRVKIEEPFWFPGYIYGINGKAGQKFEDARYPKLQRWRLELQERTRSGRFLFALTPEATSVPSVRDDRVMLPKGAVYHHLGGELADGNWSCSAEVVVQERDACRLTAIGVSRWASEEREIVFHVPVDISYDTTLGAGVIHSPAEEPIASAAGFHIEAPVHVKNHPRSLFGFELSFKRGR